MEILVTGATGFIGIEVVRRLNAQGVRPRVMVRRAPRASLLSPLDVEPVHGDLLSASSLRRAVEGVDTIIHLAGRATFEPYGRLRPTLVDGTARLAHAAAEAGVAHIVFGSSAFVYDGSTPVDDDTPTHPRLDYGRAKVAAEAALGKVAAAGGPTVASVRLPHVYGPQSLLFGLIRRRLVVFPGPGDNRFAQLHVDDAARVLVAAAEQGWRGSAPCSDGENATWNTFFDVLSSYAPRVRVVRVPEHLAAGAAAVGGAPLGRVGPTMVGADTVRGWNLDLPVIGTRLWRELGIEPRYPSVLSGIPATLDASVAFRWRHSVFDWS
ncbi:MAG: NAD(P)-dependent oxidoreductase [Actinomycetota bacterium]|nr:NAD(P)-dependent oxidoreductase [Actinomycetota bacterium]